MPIPLVGHPANKVTVLVPSHRHEIFGDALDSVRLGSFRDFQLVLTYSELWWPSKMNEVIEHVAKGLYILVLADDDRLAPNAIERMVQEAERTRSDVVFSDYLLFGERTGVVRGSAWTLDNFRIRNPVPGLTALVRYEVFRSLGGFDATQIFQDWDFWFRAFKMGATWRYLNEPLVYYNWHSRMGSREIRYDEALALLKEKHPELR